MAAVALLVAIASGEDAASAPGDGRAARLAEELGPGVEVALHRGTGQVRFIGTAPGRPIARPAGLAPSASPATVARAFLDARGRDFGLAGGSRSLRVSEVVSGPRGGAAVRLRQEIDGVPVLAGELAVGVDRRGNVLSVLGEVEPDPVDTQAAIGAGEARRAALGSEAKARPGLASRLRAGVPELAIYDSRLLGGPGLGVPALVWTVEVSAPGSELRRLVLVDARLGVVAESIGQVASVKDRRVCDAEKSDSRYPCEPPYDREEGDPATGNTDIDSAYEFAGDTYDFYSSRFGRDSLDGAGLPLVSTVRYCEGHCPFKNAFWDGEQMVYGPDFAAADDVVGHELSHGFTQFTSNLFYWYQSGAINESMSDVFGELIDLTNGAGTDTAAVRWLLGEDIPKIGAIRNMKNPPEFSDPDKMTSSLYTADVNQADEGGVHTNSGVGNKTAYLIADGETFNGKTVSGIGIDKAARVYFDAESTLLTSGSDYADLYEALRQACTNAIGGEEGITGEDCQQVTNAVDATELNQQPLNGPAPEAPVCGGGQTASDIYFDNLENPASGNWAHSAQVGGDGWYYPQNPNLFEWLDATYATSGKTNFWGYDRPTVSLSSISQTADVAIPAGTSYLRFDHSYAFEDASGNGTRYDGGQLQYSTDGGSTWHDAGPLFTDNGYNGTISASFENPLGGQQAFTAESNGYVSSRVDLSSLAGEEVRFRFRIGTDEVVDDYGWFIDDVRIYSCEEGPDETPPETTIDSGPGEGATIDDPTPTFSFSADEEPVTFECAIDEGAFSACASPYTTESLADGAHTFEVRAEDEAGNVDSTPAERSFTVDTEAPSAPTLEATEPASPAKENEPLVKGSAEPGSTVRLYTGADCQGAVQDIGTAAELASPGLTASVADNSTTTFRATAEDAAGNTSPCSSGLEYVEDSQAPNTTIDSGPEPGETISDPTPTFSFSANEEPVSFQCALDAGSFSACTSPQITAELSDGAHSFRVRATDPAGNTDPTPAERSFTVDTEAPSAPTLEATEPASPVNENEPLVKGSAEPGSTVRLYTGADCQGAVQDTGTAAEFSSPGLTASVADNSTTTFRATAEDAAGNTSPCSSGLEYVEDSQAPNTTIDSGPSGEIDDPTPTFEFSSSEGGSTFQCAVDAGSFATCTSPHTTAELADGEHTFKVRATDAAGNTDPTPAERSIVVNTEVPDETPPETFIDSGPSGLTNDATPTFSFSADEEPVSFECALDEGTFSACTSPYTTESLADGAHTFEVRAEDEAGNTDPTPAERSFTVDTEAPEAPEVQSTEPVSPANENEPLVKGSAEPGSTVRLYMGADCNGEVKDTGTAAEFVSPGLEAAVADNSTTTFRATAEDEAGNVSPCSSGLEYVEDSKAPQTSIDSGPSGPTNDPTPTFEFSADEEPVTFECAIDEGAFSACASPQTTAELSDGAHIFKARAADTAGNTDASPATREFTLDTESPSAPALEATEPASPANENEPLVKGDAEGGSTVRLYTGVDCKGAVQDTGTAAEFASPGLAATVADDSTTTFRATAEDAAGNVSPCSSGLEYVEDSQAPNTTIDSGPSGEIDDPTPTFEFSSSEGGSTFQCAVDAGSFSACASPHMTSSLANGEHTFRVRATDPAGNIDPTPAERSFTVDTEAPGAPRLEATEPASPANENEPLVQGDAEGGSTVRLYTGADCKGAVQDTGTAVEFSSPGLSATVSDDSTTTFRATAEDAAGNVSPCSSGLEYVEDSQAPQTTIDSGPGEGETISDPTPTFEFSADEEPVSFACSLDGGLFAPCVSPYTSATLADGSHTFAVIATDAAGNVDPTSAEREFDLDTAPPPEPEPEPKPKAAPEPSLPPKATEAAPEAAPVAKLDQTVAPVTGGRALLRVRCAATSPCRGVLRLMARVRRGRAAEQSRRVRRRARRVVIGKRRYAIAAGRAATVRVRLNRKGRRLLRHAGRRGLRALVQGTGLSNRMLMLRLRGRQRRS